jgi:hypothetical protein
LCLVSWLSSFFAINPQSNAYTLMIPVVAQGFHGEKPLFLSLHILCKVFCTRQLLHTCSSPAPAALAPAALAPVVHASAAPTGAATQRCRSRTCQAA